MTNPVGRALRRLRVSEPPDPGVRGILDGALDAFIDLGIRRASMTDIARRSRVSPATLYRKFASKSGLIEAVGTREAKRILAEIDQRLEELHASGADLETLMTELVLATVSATRDHQLFNRLVRTEPETVLPFFTTDGEPVLALGREFLADLLRRLQAEGMLPDYDPDPVAELLARLALSFALTRPTVVPLDDPAAARELVGRFLVPGLKGAPTD